MAPDELIEQLIQRLSDQEDGMPGAAANAIAAIGSPALQPLTAALSSANWRARCRAAWALGRIGDASVAPALCSALADSDWSVREHAREALVCIGAGAVPPLMDALAHRDWAARRLAVEALEAIGDPRAVPALCSALADNNPDVRASAAKALASLPDQAAVLPLCQALRDRSRPVAEWAAKALVAVGASAIAPVCDALSDPDWAVRVNAAEVLCAVAAPQSLAALVRALADQEPDVRRLASSALVRIGPAAVPALCAALQDDSPLAQEAAARTLAAMAEAQPNPPLRAALPQLRHLSQTSGGQTRDAAYSALEAIEAATASMRDLPLPADPPALELGELPVPSHAPNGSTGSLPVALGPAAGSSGSDAPQRSRGRPAAGRLARWLDALLGRADPGT